MAAKKTETKKKKSASAEPEKKAKAKAKSAAAETKKVPVSDDPAAYNNDSIVLLKGADRVRKRPGVIFGSDGLEGCEHSVFEIVSNSIDEAKEGYGKVIEVTRFNDMSIEIRD